MSTSDKKIVLVPDIFIFASPYAKCPNSIPNVVFLFSFVAGSSMVWYLEIVSPVYRCTTDFAKFVVVVDTLIDDGVVWI